MITDNMLLSRCRWLSLPRSGEPAHRALRSGYVCAPASRFVCSELDYFLYGGGTNGTYPASTNRLWATPKKLQETCQMREDRAL